jgi:hypothetical protein
MRLRDRERKYNAYINVSNFLASQRQVNSYISLRCGFNLVRSVRHFASGALYTPSKGLNMTSDLWYFSARTAVPSRTHLVKDLTPKLPTGLPCKSTRKLLEVAPRDAQSKFAAPNRTLPDKKMSLRGVSLRTRDRLGTQSGQRKAKKKHEYVRARGARGDQCDRSSSTGKVASDIAAAEFDFLQPPKHRTHFPPHSLHPHSHPISSSPRTTYSATMHAQRRSNLSH